MSNKKPTDYVTRADFPEVADWTKWDEIVERTKREIQEILDKYKGKLAKLHQATITARTTVYLYTQSGELKEKKDLREMEDFFRVSRATIYKYSLLKWIIGGYLLSQVELTQDSVIPLYRDRIEHGHVFSTERPTKPIYSYNENGKLISVFDSHKELLKSGKKAQRYIIINELLFHNVLYSYNRYNEHEAKEKYIKALSKKRNYIYQYNEDGELINRFNNPSEAAKNTGFNAKTLRAYAIKEKVFKGFLWCKAQYTQDEVKQRYRVRLNRRNKTQENCI